MFHKVESFDDYEGHPLSGPWQRRLDHREIERLGQGQVRLDNILTWGQYPLQAPAVPNPLYGQYEDGFYESMTLFALLVRYIYLGEIGAWTELNRRWFTRRIRSHEQVMREHAREVEWLSHPAPGAQSVGDVLLHSLGLEGLDEDA